MCNGSFLAQLDVCVLMYFVCESELVRVAGVFVVWLTARGQQKCRINYCKSFSYVMLYINIFVSSGVASDFLLRCLLCVCVLCNSSRHLSIYTICNDWCRTKQCKQNGTTVTREWWINSCWTFSKGAFSSCVWFAEQKALLSILFLCSRCTYFVECARKTEGLVSLGWNEMWCETLDYSLMLAFLSFPPKLSQHQSLVMYFFYVVIISGILSLPPSSFRILLEKKVCTQTKNKVRY